MPQACVFGLIHNPHAATAEFFKDAVMRDALSDERVGVRHVAAILGCALRLSQRIEANRSESKRIEVIEVIAK